MSEIDLRPDCSHQEAVAHDASGGDGAERARLRASRREFIKGVIASGVAVSSAGYVIVGRGGDARAQAAGAVERLVMLNVNGRDRPVDVLPNETLIRTLRYKLGLTGTKLGCDHSECGNCTVMLDADPFGARAEDHDHRRHRRTERRAAQGAEGDDRGARTAMRLLYSRPGRLRRRAVEAHSQAYGRRGAAR